MFRSLFRIEAASLPSFHVEAKLLKKHGKKSENSDEEAESADELKDDTDKMPVPEKPEKASRKRKNGFRNQKIIEYENRIRAYSTPDKIFRYFATLKYYPNEEDYRYEVYMTPEDFVRSLTPGVQQPEGLGLDQFKKFDPSKDTLELNVDPESIFYLLGQHGLISFTDYVFLLTVLSTSPRHFAIAFKMFDLNGDGELDFEEFSMVENIIRTHTSAGSRHRDHATTGSTLKRSMPSGSALANYFFGPERDKKLTIDKFLQFQQRLQSDVLWIEFNRREPVEGRISNVSFSEMLLMHSGLPEKKYQRMMKRIKRHCKQEGVCQGITFEDVARFFHFLNHINDVETALTFYQMAGANVDQPTLRHVAQTVAGTQIEQDSIDTVFTLFDENHDGELSNKEFVNVMQRRLMRGLERPKDTGFIKLLNAVYRCAKDMTPAHH